MAGIQDLIDIQFQDLTGYADNDNSDVLGTLFVHFWGPTPSKGLQRFTRQAFMQAFPAEIPYNPDGANHDILEYMSLDAVRSYAQIVKAFNLGIGRVEVRNVNDFNRFVVFSSLATDGWKSDTEINGANWAIALKYRGLIPSTLVANGNALNPLGFKIAAGPESGLYTIYVGLGTLNVSTFELDPSTDVILEEFTGSFKPNTILDGQNVYFGEVLRNSEFLTFFARESFAEDVVPVLSAVQYTIPTQHQVDFPSNFAVTDMVAFEDIMSSQTTLLINPYSITSSANAALFDAEIRRLAASKKTLNAVTGLHTEVLPNNWSVNNNKMFCLHVEGLEYFTIFGKRISLNCVGGWCGATAQVAKDVRLNQLASANSWGAYDGVLIDAQPFDKVLEAHKKGVISVYNSDSGPQIFGVRAFYKNQATYFAKANVLRVLASYLKNLIPILINAVHTDAAANSQTRTVISSQCNSVCSEFIGNQNLKPGSYVDMSDELNNDVNTHGGEYLVAEGVCIFIKLVEEVHFKIIATDSSVDVQLS